MKNRPSIALVSGGNRGIGLEVVRQLAAIGHMVLLGSRDLAKGEAAAHAIGDGYSERVIAVRLDVTNPASVERLARDVDQQFGALHVLVIAPPFITTPGRLPRQRTSKALCAKRSRQMSWAPGD